MRQSTPKRREQYRKCAAKRRVKFAKKLRAVCRDNYHHWQAKTADGADKHGTEWSEGDVKKLKRDMGRYTILELALYFNRTWRATREKMDKIKRQNV